MGTHAGEADQLLFQRELDSFVPNKVLDAHSHIWSVSVHDSTLSRDFERLGKHVTLEHWRLHLNELLPGRRQGGLLLPEVFGTTLESVQQQNEFVSREALSDPWCRPSMFVTPQMDPDYVRQEVRRLRIAGLKCYHTTSARQPPWESDIPEYLPEELVRVADEEELCITLHMVKSRAVADPGNQFWIRTYCERYPKMKMILAHAARSFNPNHAIEGMESLRGLPNLWCDMAAVTDVGACEVIIDTLGCERLLWGTDFPISHGRSRCVAVGDTFLWLTPENVAGQQHSANVADSFVFHGLESLRILKQAAWHRHLSDSEIEGIFFGNLAGMLGIEG